MLQRCQDLLLTGDRHVVTCRRCRSVDDLSPCEREKASKLWRMRKVSCLLLGCCEQLTSQSHDDNSWWHVVILHPVQTLDHLQQQTCMLRTKLAWFTALSPHTLDIGLATWLPSWHAIISAQTWWCHTLLDKAATLVQMIKNMTELGQLK